MRTEDWGLETKYARLGEAVTVEGGVRIEGYASLFGVADQGGDIVVAGAYRASLDRLKRDGRQVKMLWQHDPGLPIGVWDEVREDGKGLWVKGRLLTGIEKGREAAELVGAGAIDGLSIGYRTVQAEKDAKGRRLLREVELWEVSLVTFPMLPEARVGAKADSALTQGLDELAAVLADARRRLADL